MTLLDLNFQDSGCEPTRGVRVVTVQLRRGVRRLLRPMFVHLGKILESLIARLDAGDRERSLLVESDRRIETQCEALRAALRARDERDEKLHEQLDEMSGAVRSIGLRQDCVDAEIRTTTALHWDHMALARRISVLEDLLASIADANPCDVEAQPLIPFPGLDEPSRSRVS